MVSAGLALGCAERVSVQNYDSWPITRVVSSNLEADYTNKQLNFLYMFQSRVTQA